MIVITAKIRLNITIAILPTNNVEVKVNFLIDRYVFSGPFHRSPLLIH